MKTATRWNTREMVKLIGSIPNVRSITPTPPGGDVDTERLLIRVKDTDGTLVMCGFSTEPIFAKMPISEKNDCSIEHIMLTDGNYKNQAVSSAEPNVIDVYAECFKALRKLGYSVVHSMDDYF
jgi:hypothetical protein